MIPCEKCSFSIKDNTGIYPCRKHWIEIQRIIYYLNIPKGLPLPSCVLRYKEKRKKEADLLALKCPLWKNGPAEKKQEAFKEYVKAIEELESLQLK